MVSNALINTAACEGHNLIVASSRYHMIDDGRTPPLTLQFAEYGLSLGCHLLADCSWWMSTAVRIRRVSDQGHERFRHCIPHTQSSVDNDVQTPLLASVGWTTGKLDDAHTVESGERDTLVAEAGAQFRYVRLSKRNSRRIARADRLLALLRETRSTMPCRKNGMCKSYCPSAVKWPASRDERCADVLQHSFSCVLVCDNRVEQPLSLSST